MRPSLVGTRASREGEPYTQEANVTDAAMVRLMVEPETPYNHNHTYDGSEVWERSGLQAFL
jgi:hypothetical protein